MRIVYQHTVNQIALILEVNVLELVIKDAFRKTTIAWIIVQQNTLIVSLFLVRAAVQVRDSNAKKAALSIKIAMERSVTIDAELSLTLAI